MTVENARMIGRMLGEVVEVDDREIVAGVGWGLRVRVEMDISKALSKGIIIKVGSNGYTATVTPTEEEQVVKLTAAVSDASGEYTLKRSFNVVVPADSTCAGFMVCADCICVLSMDHHCKIEK